jgi:hypothetical protein
MAEPRRPAPKIEPHPLVEALAPDPSKPPERSIKLFGYPGRSAEPDATRLWLDLDLSSYVDVPNNSILYSETLAENQGTIVWVRADAQLRYSSVSSHTAQAEFLAGAIATGHLGAAPGVAWAAGMGPAASVACRNVSGIINCVSAGMICPTVLCPPSKLGLCPPPPNPQSKLSPPCE